MERVGEEPDFQIKVISHHRTALNRSVREAVMIRRRGELVRSSTPRLNTADATYPDW